MPPTRPERHNAKARRSVAGGSSHKKKKSKKHKGVPDGATMDPNAEIIELKSQGEKEANRRELLKQELQLSTQGASGKKKKRLEKYIEKQLKKEERVEILQKLAVSQAQLSSNLRLQSSATLGTGKSETNEEKNAKHEHVSVSKILSGRGKRGRMREYIDDASDHSSVDGNSDPDRLSPNQIGTDRNATIVVPEQLNEQNKPSATSNGVAANLGGALKKNSDGSVITPVMQPKRGKKPLASKFPTWKGVDTLTTAVQDAESSDFDSSASSDDSEEEEEEESSDHDTPKGSEVASPLLPTRDSKKRSFKEWAKEQIEGAKVMETDQQTYTNIEAVQAAQATLSPSAKKRKLHDNLPRGPMGARLELPNTSFAQAVQREQQSRIMQVVAVNRTDEVRASRILLPILAEEQRIIEAILLHPVVVVCGETGSGKTTQVPQFLYEAGFGNIGSNNPGMIGITQPRRVAAVSMASRVSQEMSLSSAVVSHQIRYNSTTSSSTAIKFMTDGVLLREMATDFLLSRYSVIIVDEAHERNLNTDILIGTLSRVIKLREEMWRDGKSGAKPLRLVIMSATLRVADFVENKTLFDVPPPVIQIDARQHPVTIHFDRRTRSDYVTQAIRKTIKIHSRLPPGGILVFMTGQQEISGVCKKLEAAFGLKAIRNKMATRTTAKARSFPSVFPEFDEVEPQRVVRPHSTTQGALEIEDIELGTDVAALAADVDDGHVSDAEALDTESEADEAELPRLFDDDTGVPMHIVPLYSLLPGEKQMKVFEPPPEGTRLVVVATNVAETSLTIPGIRYVVDCGRSKERRYDVASGIQSFQVSWISKASAAQRAGRAGRTGPGHCYRLYSSSLFEHYFDQHSAPEILRTPIEGTVLQMKSMHIDTVVNFPFPTPPNRAGLAKAELVLTRLGALEPDKTRSNFDGGPITQLGKTMAMFPLNPRFAKMLANGMQHGCLPYVIAIVSGLSVGDPFLHEETLDKENADEVEDTDSDNATRLAHIHSDEIREKEKRKAIRKAFHASMKKHSELGNAQSDVFRQLSVIGAYEFAGGASQFCQEHFVRQKAMEEIHKLRAQIHSIVATEFAKSDTGFTSRLQPPSSFQLKVLRQLLAAGFIDQIAARKDVVDKASSSGIKYASSRGVAYRAVDVHEDVFIHPSSVLFHQSPPDYIAFQDIIRGSKAWIKNVTVVNAAWLAQLGPALCTFSKPLPVPPTVTDLKSGEVLVIPKFMGWELPVIRRMK